MTKRMIVVTAAALVMGIGLFAGLVTAAPISAAKNNEPNKEVQAGRAFALRMCADCHDVVSASNDTYSKMRPPSFSAVANAKTTTAMGLNVFLVSTHAPMPNFILSEQDRRNVIAYILSLAEDKGHSS